MSDSKLIQNEELTPEQIKEDEDMVKMVQDLLGGSQPLTEGDKELVLFTEPMIYTNEECVEMMQTPEFKKGLSYALEFAGMYVGLGSFGVDAHTINEFILLEHTKNVNIATQKVINEGVKLQSATNKLRS